GSSASTAPESAPLVAECLGYLSLLACLRGQSSRSESLAVQALQILGDRGGPVEGQPPAAQVALAWREMDRYDLSAVAERVKLAERSDFFGTDPVVRTLRAVVKARLQAARGDGPGALATLERAIDGILDSPPWLVSRLRAEGARLSIANGESEAAIPEMDDLRPSDRPAVALAVAEFQLAHGNNKAVGATVADLLAKNVPIDVRVSCLLLEASRRLRSGSPARADAALDSALRLAEPIRLRRPFREAPPDVQRLLRHGARRERNHAWLSNIHREPRTRPLIPTQRLSAVTPPELHSVADTTPAPQLAAPVVDALTEKEMEVLGHLSDLLTTEEIASTMFISVNTIRTHVRSILRKLGVTRRNAAVRRARELGLLSA
ncbi:MAG: LuxR C-terminal-related transcriptional regulator, partial [Nocardioidaceae bacterium]